MMPTGEAHIPSVVDDLEAGELLALLQSGSERLRHLHALQLLGLLVPLKDTRYEHVGCA